MPLISEEQIKLLIPAIGDQIKFKQAVIKTTSNNVGVDDLVGKSDFISIITTGIWNDFRLLQQLIGDELLDSKGTKRSLFENNADSQPKLLKIGESTPVLLVVDKDGINSAVTETDIGSSSTVTDLRNSDCGLNSSFLSVAENIDYFDLKSILEGDVIGRAILSKCGKNIPITYRDRNNICEIIISYFLNKSRKLNNDLLSQIADEIIKVIPSEKKSTYFVSPIKKKNSRNNKPVVSRGKLVDKYRNKLTTLRRITENPPVPIDLFEATFNGKLQ